MSDFRFAGRWLNDRRVMSLSGDDFKAFVTAGTWMVENRSDGHIMPDDLDFIPRFTRASIPRLIIAGLWAEDSGGWLMLDYEETQTSRAVFDQLDNARRLAREKKARQRAAKKSEDTKSPGQSRGQSRDMSPGLSARTEQDRTGQNRQGEDEFPNWPTATPGDPDSWGDPSAPGAIARPELSGVK